MPPTEHFQRFTAPDAAALVRDIARGRDALARARAEADPLAVIDSAGELAAMLTTARQEAEARALLIPLECTARKHLGSEPAGWFLLALGTASQYLGLRANANAAFAESLGLAREHAWEALEHFVLAHWGRSLVEEREFSRARECFLQALALRERLNDPRASTTRRALAALAELEARVV